MEETSSLCKCVFCADLFLCLRVAGLGGPDTAKKREGRWSGQFGVFWPSQRGNIVLGCDILTFIWELRAHPLPHPTWPKPIQRKPQKRRRGRKAIKQQVQHFHTFFFSNVFGLEWCRYRSSHHNTCFACRCDWTSCSSPLGPHAPSPPGQCAPARKGAPTP